MTQNSINNSASIFDVDNLQLNGNTIISTDTNGNIVIAPDGTGDIVTGTTGTANVVSMLRSAEGQWFDMNDQTDVFGIYNSTGTPEGGITANIGSICTDTTNGIIYLKQTDSANTGWAIAGGQAGQIVQISQSTSTTSTATSSVVPYDDTLPQITEGASYMTHAHTPLASANILRIEFQGWASAAGGTAMSCSLYEQPDADAIATIGNSSSAITGVVYVVKEQAAGGTSAITFELRFGPNVTTSVGVNGTSGGSSLFSTSSISTLRVTEYLP